MGQAKNRGSLDQRVAEAKAKIADMTDAERRTLAWQRKSKTEKRLQAQDDVFGFAVESLVRRARNSSPTGRMPAEPNLQYISTKHANV